jgi:hypothetical protein
MTLAIREIERDNTALGSIASGESVLFGIEEMLVMWKLLIIIFNFT